MKKKHLWSSNEDLNMGKILFNPMIFMHRANENNLNVVKTQKTIQTGFHGADPTNLKFYF